MRTFIGTGLLGSAFVEAWLKRGEEVKVWNRTPEKAKILETLGAKATTSLEDAVTGVNRIHLVLRDDASVDEILTKAEPYLKPAVFILDHTTTSVDGAKKRSNKWLSKGINYLHAPVMMGPGNALNATGFIQISGDQSLIETVKDELESMTGFLLNYGPEVGKAAALKLISNLILLAVNAGLSDVLAVAKSTGISIDELRNLPSIDQNGLIKGGFEKIVSGEFDNPSWELVMARKDAQLMINEAEKGGQKLVAVSALAEEMDLWIEKGYAHKDWTVFTSDHLP